MDFAACGLAFCCNSLSRKRRKSTFFTHAFLTTDSLIVSEPDGFGNNKSDPIQIEFGFQKSITMNSYLHQTSKAASMIMVRYSPFLSALFFGMISLASAAKVISVAEMSSEEKVSLNSRWDLGYYLFQIQEFNAAAQEFEKIKTILPNDPSLLALIGSCYSMAGRRRRSIASCPRSS